MKITVHLKEKFHFNPVYVMTSMANVKINKIFPLYITPVEAKITSDKNVRTMVSNKLDY